MGVCTCLRFKGYRRDMPAEHLEQAFLRNSVPYSCLHTGDAWGPDGDIAAPETCAAECGRDCYEAETSLLTRILVPGRARKAAHDHGPDPSDPGTD